MSEIEPIRGWATTFDGKRIPLSRDEIEYIWESTKKADGKRRELMPDSMTAINHLHDALTRLSDEGWRPGVYCPKDGSVFAVIQFGSTGIFEANYSGEWPNGYLMMGDYVGHPEGILWKPIESLSVAEASKLRECVAAERSMANAHLASIAKMDGDEEDE